MSNPIETSFRANPLLKRTGIKIEYNEQQIEEYIKCSNDPIYFISNYVKIINIDKGEMLFELRDYQKEMIEAIHNNRRVVGRIGRQSGKCLEINTPIRLRNKITGDIMEITIGEFYEKTKNDIYTNNI